MSLPSSRTALLLIIALLPILLVRTQKTGGNLSNCKGGCELGELCIGNPFSQPEVTDSECNACSGARYWWPCNFETLCYCNSVEEGAPRVPPAPRSGVKFNDGLDPCRDVLTKDVFDVIVQPANEEGKNLYTYDGLCAAIALYNDYHDERFANTGTEEQMRAELAAFLAHAAVDTHGFSVIREEMHCVDPIEGSDGNIYCTPCKEEHYNSETKTCSQSYFESETSYKEYCDVSQQPPSGCACTKENITPANVPLSVNSAVTSIDTSGYMAASDAYLTRGAIQLSWNYDYYGASLSMSGNGNLLCDNPDLVSTNPQLAWGAGIYKWMEKMQFGTTGSTAHKQVLKGNFGGTVNVLYGDLECPSNKWGSARHVDLVRDRVARICQSGAALGVYLEMDECDARGTCLKCKGLKDIFVSCQEDGSCPACGSWPEFVRSSAPTVTPQIVDSPSWEDWSSNYGARGSAANVVGAASSRGSAASIVFLVLLSLTG